MTAAADFTVDIRYAEPSTKDRRVGSQAHTELADDWSIGAPTLAGAEDGRSWLYEIGLVDEGMTSDFFPPGYHCRPFVRSRSSSSIPVACSQPWLPPLRYGAW
jgi:hypothetical protein